jgi:1-deoxy-D-xylulose-5-phosphate synthase
MADQLHRLVPGNRGHSLSVSPPKDFAVLRSLSGPGDLRELGSTLIPLLVEDIRDFLGEKVSATGGHLGPNLGIVELSVALHRVFETPKDTVLFDIGHQAYVHKMLTGRIDGFDRLRQAGGLSGYLSRSESEYDVIENSHASTALAYADGLAKARQLSGETERRVVAVIGDGALTGGLAYESLNNLGAARDRPVIVVLNDNARSYAPTVGGIAEHLRALRSSTPTVVCVPHGGDHNFFTDLGLAYIGPVDGHDESALEDALRRARDAGVPVVVHCVTHKGHGYRPAEVNEDDRHHTIGIVNPVTGAPENPLPHSWTDIFAETLCDWGAIHENVVVVTAAMGGPTGLAEFGKIFPDRFLDVGIAEQHALASSAGLVLAGAHPVVAVYSTFLNRAIDQLLMDVALHRAPVTIVLDRAGITGPDGASHHGMWDLSLAGMVPSLQVAAPRDPARLRQLLEEAITVDDGPTMLRFPKATATADYPAVATVSGVDILHVPAGHGEDVLLIAIGAMAAECMQVPALLSTQGIGTTVVDPRWVLPVNRLFGHWVGVMV